MDTLTLPVSEVFGPVWQGEGPHAGRRCSFVRLGLCNLACEWCDTPYTWDTSRYDVAAECPDTRPERVVEQLVEIGVEMVVLSGGEPMMHQRRSAFHQLLDHPAEWHVETNGTIAPTVLTASAVSHFTVSPKVITNDPESKRIKPKVLAAFVELPSIFKFVASTPAHVQAITQLVERVGLPTERVWVMPEGVTPDAVIAHGRAIADAVSDAGFNFTLRQHTLLYGMERKR